MYIEHQRQKRRQQIRELPVDLRQEKNPPEEEYLLETTPEEKLLPEHSVDVQAHWQAPEFEVFEKDRRWYAYMALALLAIVGYAVYTNSPIMAITFILIGVVGYMFIGREPRMMDFMITKDGIAAGTELYDFDNINSFWIFYEPPHTKVISLHTNSHLIPYIHIPIHQENPVNIRELLLNYIPEEKHEQGPVEMLERLLRL